MYNHISHTFIIYLRNRKRALVVCFCVFAFSNSFSQQPFISFGSSTFELGITTGIQLNYRLGEGNTFLYGTLVLDPNYKYKPVHLNFQMIEMIKNKKA